MTRKENLSAAYDLLDKLLETREGVAKAYAIRHLEANLEVHRITATDYLDTLIFQEKFTFDGWYLRRKENGVEK